MGVSLQVYRCRIGTFKSTRTKLSKVKDGNSQSCNAFMGKMLMMFVLLSALASASLVSTKLNLSSARCQHVPGAAVHLEPFTDNQLLHRPSRLTSRDRNFLAKIVNGNRGLRGTGIKIIHWNKGSSFLHNKHDEIETIIAGHHPHVLGLSEANLKNDHDLSLVQHENYDLHLAPTSSNPDLNISRVVVYTHKSLIVKRRPDLEDSRVSAIWLEVGLPHKKKILICHGYREWRYMGQADASSSTLAAQLERWSIFLSMWEKALLGGKEVIVMMDANLDFLKWTRTNLPTTDSTVRLKSLIELLFNQIFPHGVSQLVTVPTRSWPGQEDAGLDHLYTNKPEKLSSVYAEFAGGSDHKLIKVTRYAKSLQRNVRYVRKRVFKNFVDIDFQHAVKQLSWFDLYSCEDANSAAELLTSKLTTILDQMAPVKTIQVRASYAAWLSDGTKQLLKERNDAQKLASHSKDIDDWRFYKSLRNQATARMRQEKKAWVKMKLDGTQNDPSTLWKSVKTWLNWSKTGPPSQLFHNGRLITSPAGLAGAMNSFFLSKVAGLRNTIPESNADPMVKLKESMRDRQCSLSLSAVHPEEVLKVIKSLKNSKSTGSDDIDTYVIKLVAHDILPAITHIINLSIAQSTFPTIWKHAKVVPLLKKGDSLTPKNYRPVALLPIFSKILERVVFNQLVGYLDAHNLIHPNHHGSRAGHSTASALIQMYDTWADEVDSGNMVGVMMVDLSAAFDMVDHAILLQKLEYFGLDDTAILWMKSYLNMRSQSVFVDGCLSPPLTIEHGVPQGSILGPLMYILYTNDIPDLVHNHPVSFSQPAPYCHDCGGTVCYVDDSTFSIGHSDPEVLSSTLTEQYQQISKYMAANKLVINDDKTHLLVMGTKSMSDKRNLVTLQAGDHTITPTHKERLLGCVVSDNMKWRQHVLEDDQSMIRQLTSRINGLSKISTRADMKTRLMVANGIVMSKVCYLIELWGGCEGYLLHSLQVQLNKAARLVTGASCFTSTRRLMDSCSWLSVKQLVMYQTVIMVHKTIKMAKPKYLYSRLDTHHTYRTRHHSSGCVRLDETFRCKGDLPMNSFRNRGAHDYNKIPAEIRAIRNMNTFKTRLRMWIKVNISLV